MSTDDMLPARQRLLEAAQKSFADKGFHGTSTRDIASAAGLSPGGVYVHHRSKEDMLFELSLAGHEQIVRLLEEAKADHPDDPRQQLHRMVHQLVLMHARDNSVARVVNYELAALNAPHREQIDALRHRIQELLREAIESGVTAGVFVVDEVGMTANAISGMSVDVGRWYRPDAHWTPERLAVHFADLALRMVSAA
ncbi:TetR/AcrR family transcriptional regulator [Calidifontibacter sp. DB0510]|uniref:TetR/AcrR family transcriptional regulator n=1 Tax=Metallococcus carri TaxID=1656884 RepID=A0A967B0L0_9MICO|nr:TetR/AcrR family transcriptional regulator [Metallococcus carri]NHN55228.1 TetR/AcrR family transcriptional regulator [Metallococcus carri]NOP36305.1 TetR/AcrR family transcriptional regulator [Calidifontibacter sp. DB2511S]